MATVTTKNDLLGFFNAWFEETVGQAMYPYQEKYTASIFNREPVIVNKARQIGFTTVTSACAYAEAAFEAKLVCVYSNSKENAAHIIEYANDFRRALRRFPLQMPRAKVDRKVRIDFENGGQIRSFAVSAETVRGYPADHAYLDEFAHLTGELHIDNKLLRAVEPQVAQRDGVITVLSTPGAMGNRYWEMWRDAPEKHKLTVHWTECPDLHIREETLPYGKQYWVGNSPTAMKEEDFRMEFCNEFDPGIGPAISHEAIFAAEDPDSPIEEML